MSKINITNYSTDEFFYNTIYKLFPKEFLFGSNYDNFLELVKSHFIMTDSQIEVIQKEWELKESILSEDINPFFSL